MLAIAAQLHDEWAPGAPLHPRVVCSGTDLRISWQPPAADADGTELTGVSGYVLYRAPGPEGPFQRLHEAPLGETRYVDRDAASEAWHYRITAVDYKRPPNEGPPSTTVPGTQTIQDN